MDTTLLSSVAQLSDDALISRVKHLAARERETTAVLIAHLAELEERQLHLGEGCSSLFAYCTQVLHLSEYAAYGRIQAARAARRFPALLELLAEGAVTLTTVGLLAPHLTEANYREVLEAARFQSKRQVEEIVARLHPRPPAPTLVRRLPIQQRVESSTQVAHPVITAPSDILSDQSAGGSSDVALADAQPVLDLGSSASAGLSGIAAADLTVPSHSSKPAAVGPLAPGCYKVQFTVDKETYGQLRFAQALMRHQIPDGNLTAIFSRALSVLLDSLLKQKLAATERPRATGSPNPHSRHIPAEVKRTVWARDGGRCAFVSRSARRCTEEGFLEFHHVEPYASGGEAIVENIELRCRAHNRFEAEKMLDGERLR